MRVGTWIVIGCLCLSPLASERVAWAQKPNQDATKNKNAKDDKGSKTGKPDARKDNDAKPNDGLKAVGGPAEIAKAEGKLEAMQQGILKIGTADKKEIFLQPKDNVVLNYSAEADLAWLSPGLSIRFSANFDPSGKPTAPLKSIEVFTPIRSQNLSPEQMREQTAGIYQEGKEPPPGAKNLFNGNNNKAAAREKKEPPKKEPAGGKDKAKKDAPAPGGGQAYRVIGQLANVQNNMIMVMAGQPMQLELAPDCKISVSATDLQSVMSLATKGDDVTVSGLRNPAQPEIIMAETVTIKAAKKLTQPEVPANKRGRPTRNSKDNDSKDKDKDKDTSKTKKPTDKKPKQ